MIVSKADKRKGYQFAYVSRAVMYTTDQVINAAAY